MECRIVRRRRSGAWDRGVEVLERGGWCEDYRDREVEEEGLVLEDLRKNFEVRDLFWDGCAVVGRLID